MSPVKLDADQIQLLFQFTEKKFVHWYDLQIELVDHLASRIEEEMEADPGLGFDAALRKVYAGFGIFGFAKIVQEKSSQLEKAAGKMWWKEIRSLFSWPKISLVAMLCAGLWQLCQFIDTDILMAGFAVLYVMASLGFTLYFKKRTKLKRQLLLLQVSPNNIAFLAYIYQGTLIVQNSSFSTWQFCIMSMIGILIMIATYQCYARIRKKAMALYPDAFES